MRHLKHLPLEGAFNVRDLGGYPAAEGTGTCWHRLYRSDAPAALTPADWDQLKEAGLCRLIDLRSGQETETAPVIPPEGVDYFHISLMQEVDDAPAMDDYSSEEASRYSAEAIDKIVSSTCVDYASAVKANFPRCVSALDTLYEGLAGGGSVLFFCSAGKDRTGIIAALVLLICGVSREDIVADYMVSAIYNERGVNRQLQGWIDQMGADFPGTGSLKRAMASDASTMERLLDAFEAMDILGKLDENGFTREKQAGLRKIFCED